MLRTKYKVTSAEVHDYQVIENVLDENDRGEPLSADDLKTNPNIKSNNPGW